MAAANAGGAMTTMNAGAVMMGAVPVINAVNEQQQKLPEALSNPRRTMETFVTAIYALKSGQKENNTELKNQVISTFDLSDISSLIRRNKGIELAHILSSVMERTKEINLDSIPVNPISGQYVYGRYSQGQVDIVLLEDGRWLFSQQTIKALPAILEGLIASSSSDEALDPQIDLPLTIRIESRIPSFLRGSFLLEYWQWLGIFIFIVVGSAADKFLAWFLERRVIRLKKKYQNYQDVEDDVLRPLGLMAMAFIWWFGIALLNLPDTALVILSVSVKLIVAISTIWSVFRLIDIVHVILVRKAHKTASRYDDVLVPMITKSMKVFAMVVIVITAADNFNVDITSLLTGLGIGGIAFALAAKDLLGNFFGSLTVVLDQPFQIGDWVIIGDIEGSIEQVGFRSTRIRTFYNSLITMPNAMLTTSKIDNMGARRYRRMKSMLNVTYDTSPEKIDAFCEGIRSLIQLHPYMRKDYYQVYFNEYGPASLNILLYVFWETPDWNTELRERHRFLLDILRLAKQLNVEFAFPTQTLHLKQDSPEMPANMNAQVFQTEMTEQDAFEMGRKEATAIVDGTLGQGVKPDPVRFP
jgi:MscS family membrane protein